LATQTEPVSAIDERQKKPVVSVFKFILDQRTLLVLIVLCALVGYLIPSFLTSKNILNVMRQVSITGIVAVGMTFVIITGGIDISVGSTVALSSVVVASALKQGLGIPAAITLALFSGVLVGLLNGTLVAYGRVLPFVATLGTMYVIRGLALIVTKGEAIWDLPKSFLTIGTGYWLGIPIPVIITLIVYLLGHFLLRNFTFGRYVLAVGGDEESARLCGVAVKRIKLYTYALCGFLAGLAGIVLAGRLGSGQPSTGVGYELVAIAAAVIGGNSLDGGRGTVIGTLIGAFILGVVSNALNLWGVASFWQTVISGCIVLIAVLADTLRKRRGK
jgi:ribose/xylose/arabinose/galactoside ABC-type transport system permease subunit